MSSLHDHPYRVRPKQAMDLTQIPSSDRARYHGSKKKGQTRLVEYTQRIAELQSLLFAGEKHGLLVVFQAMDTGGKDGTIRRVFGSMLPQGLRVASFKRPSPAELAHDYLWRVHPHVPSNGETVIFNRSHYEDIVAVRVHDIFPQSIWSRRYHHIVEFERMLAEEGTTIIKIFLHISLDEQKERLQARLDEPTKQWKFNPGDLKERALWPKYMKTYSDVLSKTSTDFAPWYIIPADSKWRRDLSVAEILIQTLEDLSLTTPEVNFDPKAIHIE